MTVECGRVLHANPVAEANHFRFAKSLTMIDALHSAFGVGVEAQHLTITQVVLRAVLIFFAALWRLPEAPIGLPRRLIGRP